ncbi:MAG TPA: phasin family protein [Roseiarcus sp.]|jgi:hypothetical protein
MSIFKNFEDIQAAGKERFEAATAATANILSGLQQIAVEVTSYSRDSASASLGLVQDMFSVKTLEEAVRLQSSYAKSAHESLIAQTSKIGQLYADLAKEGLKPVEISAARPPVKAGKVGGAV